MTLDPSLFLSGDRKKGAVIIFRIRMAVRVSPEVLEPSMQLEGQTIPLGPLPPIRGRVPIDQAEPTTTAPSSSGVDKWIKRSSGIFTQ